MNSSRNSFEMVCFSRFIILQSVVTRYLFVQKVVNCCKAILQIIAKTVVTGFSAVVLYYSCHMAAIQASSGQLTAALHIPMAIPYFALVISFAIITCVQGITVITMLVHFNELSNPHTVDEKGGD